MSNSGKYRIGSVHRLFEVRHVVGQTMDGFGGTTMRRFWTDNEADLPKIKKIANLGAFDSSTVSHSVFVKDDGYFYDMSLNRLAHPRDVLDTARLESINALRVRVAKHFTAEERRLLDIFGVCEKDAS